MSKILKPVSLAVGAAFLGSVAVSAYATQATGFAASDLSQGYMLVGEEAPAADKAKEEGKCGEGKCGADKAKAEGDKAAEGKCGEGKCGADKAKAEGDKAAEEGKCGADKKGEEGKCGAA